MFAFSNKFGNFSAIEKSIESHKDCSKNNRIINLNQPCAGSLQFHFNLVIALCTTSGFVLVISLLSTPQFIGSLLQFCKEWIITELLLLGLLIVRLSSSSALFHTSLLQINLHTDIQRWSVRVDVLTGCVVSFLLRCCSLSSTPKNSYALQNSRVCSAVSVFIKHSEVLSKKFSP